jgi:hypothetical protein
MIDCATHSVTTSASVKVSSGIFCPFGQEIVSDAEHVDEQQVEVGEHRGPSGSAVTERTADFDPAAYVPFNPAHTPQAVELLI